MVELLVTSDGGGVNAFLDAARFLPPEGPSVCVVLEMYHRPNLLKFGMAILGNHQLYFRASPIPNFTNTSSTILNVFESTSTPQCPIISFLTK